MAPQPCFHIRSSTALIIKRLFLYRGENDCVPFYLCVCVCVLGEGQVRLQDPPAWNSGAAEEV